MCLCAVAGGTAVGSPPRTTGNGRTLSPEEQWTDNNKGSATGGKLSERCVCGPTQSPLGYRCKDTDMYVHPDVSTNADTYRLWWLITNHSEPDASPAKRGCPHQRPGAVLMMHATTTHTALLTAGSAVFKLLHTKGTQAADSTPFHEDLCRTGVGRLY